MAARREVQRVTAPIVGVAAPFHQPSGLEVVHEEHHGVGVDPERSSERLL